MIIAPVRKVYLRIYKHALPLMILMLSSRIRLMVVLCACWITAVSAQEMPQLKNYSPELMQAANQNWSVTQTPSRYIYTANTAGVVQYDGNRWSLLPLPNQQIVRSVSADNRGNVFCGGFGEFGYWRAAGMGVSGYVSLSDSLETKNKVSEEIWHILIAEGKVYFQSFSELYVYDYHTVKQISLPGNIMFMRNAGDKILLPVIGRGVYVKTKEDKFTLLEGTEALNKDIVVGMAALGGDRILIGTDRNGLFIWEKGQLYPWDTPVQKQLVKSRLNKVSLLADRTLALGTVGDGVFIANVHGHILHHIYRERGLQNNTVLALYEDMDSNLWIGLDKGLDLLMVNSPLRFSIDRSGSLGAVFTAALHKNFLYLGTNQGLFYRPWKAALAQDLTWRPVPGINGQVWELSKVRGRLMCGHTDGTFLIDQGSARKISDVTGGWVSRIPPWDSSILIQGTYTGLIAYRCDDKSGVSWSHRIEGFNEPVEYMEFDEAGRLWVAHPYRGLHWLELSKDAKRIISSHKMPIGEFLPTDFNLRLQILNNKLLLHAANHFYRWNEQEKTWVPHRSENGVVFNGKEKALIPWKDSHFFLVYADRVVCAGYEKSRTLNLRLVNDRPNILPLGDSSWLFCLEDGYASWFYEKKFSSDEIISPKINQITTIQKNNRRIIFPQSNPETELTLRPSENHISIYYTTLVFDQQPQYRWRLEGLQYQWSDWQENSVQDFNYLPPGAYKFEVQSDLTPSIASFAFRIKPRWHQTWYFRLSLFVVGAVVSISALRWYRLRLERQHRRMLLDRERQLHQQRIQERNLQLQEDVFKKAKDLANSTMQLIRKNEVLLDIKQRLISIHHEVRNGAQIQHLVRLVDQELSSENDWAVFEENFNSVHEAFLRKMKQFFPELTPGDLRLAAYLKMNLSSKEIAPLLGISIRGVENKRYRLRKKMGLPTDENLVEFLLDF